MQDSGAVGEFIEETWGILDSLSAACANGQTAIAFKEGLKTIERNLHTIMGNAAAFGFEELSEAASRTLDWLRTAMRATGKSLEKPQDAPPVLEFTGGLRKYLTILNPAQAPPVGFWSGMLVKEQQVSPSGASGPQSGRRSLTPQRAAAEPNWDEEAKIILSQAPLVTPQIDGIVWMAVQRLTGRAEESRPEFTPVEAAAKPSMPAKETPRAGPVAVEPSLPLSTVGPASVGAPMVSDAAVHAYAVEAVVKTAWLRGLQEKCRARSWLEAPFSEAADVLESFAKWSVETRSAPLRSFLAESRGGATRKPGSREGGPAVDWTGSDIRVLPVVGQLIQALLDRLVGAAVLGPHVEREQRVGLKAVATRAGGCIQFSLSGLPGLERAKPKLQLELLRQRIENCGVSLTHGTESGGESVFTLSVPDHLDGMEALIVAAGDDRMGIPGHRVRAVVNLESSAGSFRCEDRSFEMDGENLPLLDLSAEPNMQKPSGSVVIVGTDKGKRALRVDAIIGKQLVILTALEPGVQPGEAFVRCFALEGLEWMPFLWCSSRLFEEQESLVLRH